MKIISALILGLAVWAQAPQPHLSQGDLDIERARIALLKALVRLNVASRARTRA